MARFYVICSDSNHIGKTFLARLLCDYLILIGRPPHIFDASQTRCSLRNYFVQSVTKIDLLETVGQIALFDRALSTPNQDSVLDLPANLLPRLLQLIKQFGFGNALYTPDVKIVPFFLVDNSVESVLTARRLRMEENCTQVVVVKNEGTVPCFDALAEQLYSSLSKDGGLIIPYIENWVWRTMAKRTFSFSAFAKDPLAHGSEYRSKIGNLLVTVYEQLDQIGIGNAFLHADPHKQGRS
jgi:hypothetical protein